MRRFRMLAMVLSMAAVAAGCGGDGGDDADEDVTATTTAAVATTVAVPSTAAGPTIPMTDLTLRIADVRLVSSEEPDRGMRVLLPPGVRSASVTVTGLPSPNRTISVCQVSSLEGQESASGCRNPNNGEALTVTLGDTAKGVEILPDAPAGGDTSSGATTLEEVAIRYTASSREVNVRLPQIASGEAGGRPTFRLEPPSADGAYRAALTWRVIAVFGGTPTNGQLELVQDGSTVNQAQGGGEVRLSGTLPAPAGDVAIRAQNVGQSALVTPLLNLLLP